MKIGVLQEQALGEQRVALVPGVTTSLDTANHPEATIALTRPVTLDPAFVSGGTVTATVTGELTLRGVANPGDLRRHRPPGRTALQATGTIPVAFADWGIPQPHRLLLAGLPRRPRRRRVLPRPAPSLSHREEP